MTIRPSDLLEFARDIYRGRRFILTPYAFPVNFGTLAASGNGSQSLSITANADFILTRVRYKGKAAATGAAVNVSQLLVPNVSLLITDQGSNEQYSSAAVPVESYGFNSQFVGDLPFPRWITGRTALSLQVTNNDSASPVHQFVVTLEGVLARQLSDN